MKNGLVNWLFKSFPQNMILRKPLTGTVILSALWFIFMIIYRPLGVKEARFSFALTMAAYGIIQGVFIYLAARLIKRIPFFSGKPEWNILKEAASILSMLLLVGIIVYFAGFVIEPPARRWNIPTFLDSCKKAVLIGLIPFGFFTAINFRYLFYTEKEHHYNPDLQPVKDKELLHISSQLKKEDLNFHPGELIYCESDGNYVVFHLVIDNLYSKKIIRNSINNIEQQLTNFPYFMRVHRAFIINLKMVEMKKGNALGYRLKFAATDKEVPVSRNNTRQFDQRIKQFR